MSTEQHNQQSNTSQQTDRASPSPHRRSVSQHNSSSNPEHIASRFRHRRSFTGSDQRSPISHVARSATHHLLRRLSFAPSLVACSVACRSSLGLGSLRCSLNLNLNLKVFHHFSIVFFLTLSLSLSLYLKNESESERVSLSLSFFSFKAVFELAKNCFQKSFSVKPTCLAATENRISRK